MEVKEVRNSFKYVVQNATRQRKVEDALLNLFTKGELNGTIHTCNGQEFSAIAFNESIKLRKYYTGFTKGTEFDFSCSSTRIDFASESEGAKTFV